MRRLSSSRVVSIAIVIRINKVAAESIVGLICSRIPENICHGIVRCLYEPTKRTTTTSSNEVTKAKRAPEITPGVINGTMTLKKVVLGGAPKLCDARIKLLSNPVKVAVTVITTNGVPSAA